MDFGGETMAGTKLRSGGRNKRLNPLAGDGWPELPRPASVRAAFFVEWLLDRLPSDRWSRIDGAMLLSVAELLELQEIVAAGLAADPTDPRFMRLRMQCYDKLKSSSAVFGLAPVDRARLPSVAAEDDGDDVFNELLARMGSG